ncbi:phosphoglycerate dehydrogenase [Opitutaceae bacterium TAV5]|nr:phosphoglycerate dehydrogenase [Opitutaceae bacterium TAV5]
MRPSFTAPSATSAFILTPPDEGQDSPAAALSSPRSRLPQDCRIVALLSPFELAHFFPEGLPASIPGSPAPAITRHEIPEAAAGWDRFLDRVRPDILLAGWDMPPLPPFASSRSGHRLRYLCYLTGTVRKKVPRCWLENGLLLTNWGGSVSHVVAESALMMILCALRCVTANQENLHHRGGWKLPGRPEQSLFGRTVGLHGFGRVAQALARLLQPFGVTLRTYAPGTPESVTSAFRVHVCDSLETLFATSSVLVEAAPLNPHTLGIVDRRLLALLPEGAAFINVGRGPVVVESDLLEAAVTRRLRIALDVFDTEPLPPDSPWRAHPEILLMPHQAGPTLDRCRDAGAFALKQIGACLQGRQPEAIVTPRIWDEST